MNASERRLVDGQLLEQLGILEWPQAAKLSGAPERRPHQPVHGHRFALALDLEGRQRLPNVGVARARTRPMKPPVEASSRGVLELSYDFARRLADPQAERRSLYWMGWLDASLGCWTESLAHFERCVPLASAPRGIEVDDVGGG